MARRNNRSQDEREHVDSMRRTTIERTDRHLRAGARGDHAAGNEGIDDPAMAHTSANDLDDDLAMEASDRSAGVGTRMTTGSSMAAGDRSAQDAGEGMRKSSRQHTERGMDNDRQHGRESGDSDAADFSGQGDQREGAERPEGTGYTKD